MKRFLPVLIVAVPFLAISACSEEREKVADLFRGGESAKHTVQKADPQMAEDLDMSKMTLESLKKQGVKMTEIPVDAVFVSPERQQITGVRFGQVTYRNLQKVIRTVGRLEFDEKKVSTVNPKIGGWIEELYVDYTGKIVRKGQPLLSIYSPELVSAQEEYLLALKAKKILSASPIADISGGGESLLQATRKRLLLWDITPKQIETLERTGEVKKNMVLYAPADGFVMEKMAYKGMSIMPGMTLYKIGDLSTIWLAADIYEYELPLIQVGQKALITLAYFPGESFEGTATYIYPSIDPNTRTAKVRFDLPNPEFKLKPEMWANVELRIPLGRKLVIPDEAVIDTGLRQVAILDRGSGYFEPRQIKIGTKVDNYYEVIGGLKAGDRVVTSANFLIDSESKFKEAIGGMSGMPGMEHGTHGK